MPTEWWLRPLSSAARVGAHSAVVWKRLYASPPPLQPLRGRRAHRPAEGAARAEADIVEQHDQDVGRALGRQQRPRSAGRRCPGPWRRTSRARDAAGRGSAAFPRRAASRSAMVTSLRCARSRRATASVVVTMVWVDARHGHHPGRTKTGNRCLGGRRRLMRLSRPTGCMGHRSSHARRSPMSASQPTRSRGPAIVVGVIFLALVIAAAAGLWYLFFRPAGPAPVSLASLPPVLRPRPTRRSRPRATPRERPRIRPPQPARRPRRRPRTGSPGPGTSTRRSAPSATAPARSSATASRRSSPRSVPRRPSGGPRP